MKNNQKGFASIILIGVVVALIAVAGYFAFRKKSGPITQPSPMSVVTQPNTPIQVPASADKTPDQNSVTNNMLHFSVKLPVGYHMVQDNSSTYGISYINNAVNNGMQGTIRIQMWPGWTTDLVKDLSDAGVVDTNVSYVKSFKSANDLTGITYIDPKKFLDKMIVLYPSDLQLKVQPTGLPQITYPVLGVTMEGYDGPFTAEQNNVFYEVINSLQFTK